MDDKIVRLLLDEDPIALELIKEQYNRLLEYIISNILNNRNDIEECINDTYYKLWKNAKNFDASKASLKTYIIVIARNTAISRLEHINSLKRRDSVLLDESISYKLEDSTKNIEENYLCKEELRYIVELINQFKPKDKEIMYRRYYYNQPSKLIAEALGMSVGAVDIKICKLRKKLKKEYLKQYMQKGGKCNE